MLKKMVAVLLSAVMVIGIGGMEAFAAEKETVQESAIDFAGDAASFSKAIPLAVGNTVNGAITETEEEQVYSFSLASSGRVTLTMTSYMRYYGFDIYDSAGERVWYSYSNYWNENLQYVEKTHSMDLFKGSYYLRVSGEKGTYMFTSAFVSANVTYDELNNDFASATVISAGGTINGQIAINDSEDIYKITFTKPGRLSMDMTSYMNYYRMIIYNSQGEKIWDTDNRYWNENLQYTTENWYADLSADYYYISITGFSDKGNYSLTTSFKDAGETITEPNNEFSTAYRLSLNQQIQGQIAEDDEKDIFIFTLDQAIELGVSVTSYMEYYSVYIYDSNGESVWSNTGNRWNENVGYRSDNWKVTLSAGTYYLEVREYANRTGNYTLSIGAMPSMRDASVAAIGNKTYTGNYIKPALSVTFNGKRLTEGVDYTVAYSDNLYPGKATATLTGTGVYTGTKQVSFKILPKKQTITHCYNSSNKTVYLQWSSASGVSGYEVYRSTSKSSGYKRCYTSKSSGGYYTYVKKLTKGKKYYFKVRSYVVIDGKKYYGKFSGVKSLKIKK